MSSVQQVSDSYLCSNCGACSVVCPKEAIDFRWTSIGRLQAFVNNHCVNCGLCLKVCPSIDFYHLHEGFDDRFLGNIKNVYIGKSNISKYFNNGQSGGVATSILSHLFDSSLIDAAIVCRMKTGDIPFGEPFIVTSKDKLYESQKSCYTPVPLLTILKDIINYKSVAIVGLPCQINGVEEIIKCLPQFSIIKYKIGLICDRTECAGIQYSIKDYTGFDEFKIEWRKKYDEYTGVFDYKCAPIVASSPNGKSVAIPRYFRIAQKEMFTSPRCRACWDKLNVFSDISLGDPWRIKDVDLVHGESLVICRSAVGNDIISQMLAQNTISIKKVDNDVPNKSQLIADRRNQVNLYSAAFSCLPVTIDSYLLHQHTSNISCTKEKNILKDFVKLESMSCEEVLNKAKSVVEEHFQAQRKRNKWYIKVVNHFRTRQPKKTNMRIVLSGVETNNKGAELMLYAILQELERSYPDAEVFLSRNMVRQGLSYIKTTINLHFFPHHKIPEFFTKIRFTALLNRIGLYSSYLNDSCPVKNIDYYIDGSGLLFSDKRISSKLTAKAWGQKLKVYKKSGAKVVFLPQGFGPFDKSCTQRTIIQLDKYADLIFAREKVSFQLLNDVVINHAHIKLFPDFTSLVEGVFPSGYERFYGKVCIIPNRQMINKGVIDKHHYFDILNDIISTCKKNGNGVYFLNHEGPLDEKLMREYNKEYGSEIEVVTGLNALEVKGLISTAYLVVSSRFHGVASALNGGVPCLATSWHHKYEELFSDFNQFDCILNLADSDLVKAKVQKFLNEKTNKSIRESLLLASMSIKQQNQEMWEMIWSLQK